MRRTIPLIFLASASVLLAAPRVVVSSDSEEAAALLTGMLAEGGLKVESGGITPGALSGTDVLVFHRAAADPLDEAERDALEGFAKRGGGVLALGEALAAGEAAYLEPIFGGAWSDKSRSFESTMMLYTATDQHPIVAGASPFDIEDRTAYDLERNEGIRVLASAFTPKLSDRPDDDRDPPHPDRQNIFDVQPQVWAFENTLEGGRSHRAMVILQTSSETYRHRSIGAFILRGISWAAGEDDLDARLAEDAAHSLRYPVGGPRTGRDTVAQLKVEPGFQASLVAEEPLVNKPIAIQWDASGRLWVAESPEYPNGRRERVAPAWRETGALHPDRFDRPAEDKISILSDPDEHGKFTRKTIFHEGLELVTGFCLHGDGVIAVHQPDIVWVRDTDGDGRSDKVERLFTGFEPGDTHFVANHLIAAPDGWIYASMGGGADARRPDARGRDAVTRIGSGVFRFRPDGSAIEQVSSKGGNGFGIDVTSDGEIFFGQATTGNPVQHVALPEWTLAQGRTGGAGGAQSVIEGRKIAGYQPADRASLMQIDVVGGYSAACSSLIYEGGAWPDAWHRSIFCTEPLVNIVHREALVPAGPTFAGEMQRTDAEFIHSPDDYWFRPIDVALGPDGALYLLDFYNPVVAHNDTRGPLHSRSNASVRPDREHYFGRIYRVQHEQAEQLEVPDLVASGLPEQVAALSHPNRIVRFNALNLLVGNAGPEVSDALGEVAASGPTNARILALWGLHRLGKLPAELLASALADEDAAVRKSAALVAEEARLDGVAEAIVAGIADTDPRVRIAMLRALARTPFTDDAARALVALYPTLGDDLTKSAAVAAAAPDRPAVLRAALTAEDPQALAGFAGNVADLLVERREADVFARLLPAMAEAGAAADPLKVLLLEKAAQIGHRPIAPVPDAVFASLLESPNFDLRAATLPIAVSWSSSEALKPALAELADSLLARLSDGATKDAERIRIIGSLVGARQASPKILPAIGGVLADPEISSDVRRAALEALRSSEDAAAGSLIVSAFGNLDLRLQQSAMDVLLSRAEWTGMFLDAVEQGDLSFAVLSPNDVFRLRSHPAEEIASRAVSLLDEFRKPNADKEALIAELLPTIRQSGDRANGEALFAAACATCHRLDGKGTDVGPALDGIGAHGPAQLLISIVDPNRQIDAGYELYNIETHDGSYHAGMIARQNEARVVLRSMAGDVEIPTNSIKSRTNTARSLMPEGLEGLGAEALRDIIAYMTGDDSKHRVVDLSNVVNADARRGLYQSQEARHDAMRFAAYGIVKVDEIPFHILDSRSNPIGGNVITLRGGGPESFAHTHPLSVEVPVGHEAKAFHLLGGVAGWGSREPKENGEPVMKLTFVFADGRTEEKVLRNGVEFADHIDRFDVPGSKFAEGVLRSRQQVRWFTVPLEKSGTVEKIVMEGYGNGPAPTTVAITAELP